jgi:hypothetical protein
VSVFGAPPKAEVLTELAEAGVDRAVFVIPPADAESNIPRLQRYAELGVALGA